MTYTNKYSTELFAELDEYFDEQLEYSLLVLEEGNFFCLESGLHRLREDIEILKVEFFSYTPFNPLDDEDEKFLGLVNNSELRAYDKFKNRIEVLHEVHCWEYYES